MTELDLFNSLPEDEARARLATCLDVPRWVDVVLAGRPYADRGALMKVAEVGGGRISTTSELEAALARHPRIGERASAGHDAAFSARRAVGGRSRRRRRLAPCSRRATGPTRSGSTGSS